MNESETSGIRQRLDRLERQNRQFRVGATALFVLCMALLGTIQLRTANAQPRTLDVERLNVIDKSGVVRASLFIASPGPAEINFNLNDENGHPLISMGGIDGTSIISMLDAAGRGRVLVQVGSDGMGQNKGPTVSLFDEAHSRIWSAP
jgi:hypothetical protein